MKPEFLEELVKKYPELFKYVLDKNTHFPICEFGLELNGDGWNNLIDVLCSTISHYVQNNNGPNVRIVQIKEKFGTLRVYCDNTDEVVVQMIDFAENLSDRMCEHCGGSGVLRDIGYLTTLCDTHYKNVKNQDNTLYGRFAIKKDE